MKARFKATGEIVDVNFDKDALANDYPPYRTNEIPSRFFLAEQLEWIDIKEKELAEQLGISVNAMCNIEKGYSCPSGMTIERICALLNVELKLIEK